MIHSRYKQIPTELFTENRSTFCNKLRENELAIIFSNDEMPRNADCNFPFRQDSNFFYLTGIEQERSVLLLFPNCPNPSYKEVLFLRPTDEHTLIWEGKRYDKNEAAKVSGISTVLWLDQYEKVLEMLLEWAETVYVNSDLEQKLDMNFLPLRAYRWGKSLCEEFPDKSFKNALPIFTELRAVKKPLEIAIIEQACKITEQAFRRVLNRMKPGLKEYEIEAEISHEFTMNGAAGHAYSPIIASGKNACVLHYVKNNEVIKDGDLILMDFGAEYGHYASDLTRTIPANGIFTARQKEVYKAVLDTMNYAIGLLKPGVVIPKYHMEIGAFMNDQLVQLGLLSTQEVKENKVAFKKYFMHGTSHFMGLDVHDVGNRELPLVPGNIVTCEPGIYIPEEGIGIRIENDILITKDGNRDLMKNIPIEIDEIESLMKG
jgi:Xaa-Pro aminopeptidase